MTARTRADVRPASDYPTELTRTSADAGVIVVLDGGLDSWHAETDGWLRNVRRKGRSDHTLRMYVNTLRDFERCQARRRRPLDPAEVSRRDVQAYIEDMQDRGLNATTQATRFSALSALFTYLADDDVIEKSPVRRADRPERPVPVTPILSPVQITQLLKATHGADFLAKRDELLIRLLLSTGLRRSEVAGLLLTDGDGQPADVDERTGQLQVIGKGNRPRPVTYGDDTAKALRVYLRARALQANAARSSDVVTAYGQVRRGRPLFLVTGSATTKHDALSAAGIGDVLAKRGQAAGLGPIRPHQLRHTWTHLQLSRPDMRSEDVAKLGGWSSTRMLSRYGAVAASARALKAYRDPMDHIDVMAREERR